MRGRKVALVLVKKGPRLSCLLLSLQHIVCAQNRVPDEGANAQGATGTGLNVLPRSKALRAPRAGLRGWKQRATLGDWWSPDRGGRWGGLGGGTSGWGLETRLRVGGRWGPN